MRFNASRKVDNLLYFIVLLLLSASLSCTKYPEPVILSTLDVTEVTSASATSGGVIVYGEETGISRVGLVWGTTHDPSLESHAGKLTSQVTNPRFEEVVAGLEPSTLYYIRAWAMRGNEIIYGNELHFTTFYGAVTDIDGNTYNTVKAGGLEWMGSNLTTSRYSNGDAISNITGVFEWRTASEGAWSYYLHSEELGKTYGKLYNWHAVSDNRGLCPAGWHVPSDEEWKMLETGMGMTQDDADRAGLRDRYAGGSLKANGTEYWRNPNMLATDLIGFAALPGGYMHPDGRFYTLRRNANWWTSTDQDENNAIYRNIYFNNGGIYRNRYNQSSGFSVRCVRKPGNGS